MNKFDIVSLGEILIDYTPMADSPTGMKVFEQNPGGAPANVLAGAVKFGSKTAFIGKVGNDDQGYFLKSVLEKANIDTRGLIIDNEYFTTLSFLTLSPEGERSCAFARSHSADINLSKEDINMDCVNNTKIFHFGSLSLTHEKCKEATLFAVEKAIDAKAIISYDPNYRNLLWPNSKVASKAMQSVIKYVDIMKISDEETELLTGYVDPKKAIECLLEQGVTVVMVTLGADGAMIGTKEGITNVAGFTVSKVVDTTGAGDSFWASILHHVAKANKPIQEYSLEELATFAKFANATASLNVQRRGAIPGMPELGEVESVLNNQ